MAHDRESIWHRYRHLLRRRTTDDVNDELRFHLDMRVEEAHRAGLSEPDAHAAALERFGEYQTVEAEVLRIDEARERRRGRLEWLAGVRQDVTFAVRSLRRAPSFALAAIATLAIAIGANTAIYSVVHALLLAPLPYAQPEQLVTLWGHASGELLALRTQLRTMSDIAAYGGLGADLDDGAVAEHLEGASVSANFFDVLGSRSLVGRTFAATASDRGQTDVVILSHGLWQRRFGEDRRIVGRRILLDGKPATIIGVMPAEFAFPSASVTFWKPFVIDRNDPVSLWAGAWHNFVGRLRPSATVDAARREVQAAALGLRHANVLWDPGPTYGKDATVGPLLESMVGSTRPLLVLLSGCAALVLVIACVNVANLLLARASARERELAVRAALGGGRGRLVRQLLTESIVLSLAGAVVGSALAASGLRSLIAILPPGVPRASEITMNGAALGFTAALAIVAGIVFGTLPAFRATTGHTGGDVARAGRTGRGTSHQRVSAFLVGGEIALAVLVVISAELLVRSFRELRQLDPGFRTTNVVAARITPPRASYADAARMDAFYTIVMARAASLPGVHSVGAVNALPLAQPSYGLGLRIEGQYEDATHVLPTMDHWQIITPAYIATLGMRLLRGRDFTNDDRRDGQPVAIVSESMARHFWPNGDAIGKRVGYAVKSPWMTIVGIVADVKLDSLRDSGAMTFYSPYLQRLSFPGTGAVDMTIVARTAGDAAATGAQLRALVASIDRSVPVSEIETIDDVIARSVAKPRFTMLLVGAFAVVALLLGAVGIYGVMSYVVSQRMQELGIRTALGATAANIVTIVVSRAAILAGAGALAGMAAAFVAIRPLRSLLYGVTLADPVTYLTVPVLFVVVALVASLAPALRATRVSPTSVLRAD
jgi:putative ABC transport system permease protein